MTATFSKSIQKYAFLLLPIGVILFSIGLIQTSFYQQNAEQLSLAITLDLLLTGPLLYFLVIRKKEVPKITVLSFIVVGTIVASFALPEQDQHCLNLFKTFGVPILELGVFTFLFINIRKTVKAYRAQKKEDPDFLSTMYASVKAALGDSRPTMAIATEVAVIYYALFKWKKQPLVEGKHFTYHLKSGASALYLALMGILAIEVIPLHVLLEKWSPLVAWILSFASVYTILQVWAHLKAVHHRPVVLEANELILRNGIMADTVVPYSAIESIEWSNRKIELEEHTQRLTLLEDLEPHNLVIRVKVEGLITGPYGIRKPYRQLLFYVDDKVAFKAAVETKIQQLDMDSSDEDN
ncbi:MAG: hypothetical protein AAF985_18575 [Bacteroidota bacterium]